jgi:hypothetical protein
MEGSGDRLKLIRFLATTARRGGISKARVAAVVLVGNKLALNSANSLPAKETDGLDIDAALSSLEELMGLETLEYIGYADCVERDDIVRRFHFTAKVRSIRKAPDIRLVSLRSPGLFDEDCMKAVRCAMRRYGKALE